MNIKRVIKNSNLSDKIRLFAQINPLSISIKDKKDREILYYSNDKKKPVFSYPITNNDEILGKFNVSENGCVAEYILKVIDELISFENQITEISNETLALYREINLFYDLSTIINKQQSIEKRLDTLLDRCTDYNDANNASIWILEDKVLKCMRYKGNKPGLTFKLGEGFMGSIALSGNGEMLNCPIVDTRWSGTIGDKTSIIGTSLYSNRKIIGILNISRFNGKPFSAKNLKFANMFAHIASQEIEINRLIEDVKRETIWRTNLSRFLSPNLVNIFADEKNEVVLGGEKKTVTILFLDIVNFTSLSERLDSKVTVEILNEYFTTMTDIIFKFDGTLDKFIGDALMAIFGAPKTLKDHAKLAVEAGLLIQKTSHRLFNTKRKEEKTHFQIRVGINTGIATVGNIGSPNRLEYTAIGDIVNTAYRIESFASPGELLVGEETYKLVKDFFRMERLNPISVKGKDNLINVYKVLG